MRVKKHFLVMVLFSRRGECAGSVCCYAYSRFEIRESILNGNCYPYVVSKVCNKLHPVAVASSSSCAGSQYLQIVWLKINLLLPNNPKHIVSVLIYGLWLFYIVHCCTYRSFFF